MSTASRPSFPIRDWRRELKFVSVDIAKWRKELGLTQQDAAMLIGVSRVTYIKYEGDIDSMPIGKFRDFIHALQRLSSLRDAS